LAARVSCLLEIVHRLKKKEQLAYLLKWEASFYESREET
jgi:hypothetical protein